MQLTAGVELHDAVAPSWSARYDRGSFALRRRLADELIRRVVAPGEAWVDAGCGTGIFTRVLAECGATGLAVDASRVMLKVAEQETAPASPGFTFCRVDTVAALGCADRTIDGVLCLSVVEYLPDLPHVLQEFARVLRDSGKLVLSIPNRRSPVRLTQSAVRRAVRAVGWRPFPYLNASITAVTEHELREQLGSAGFVVDDLVPFDTVLPQPLQTVLPASLMFVVARKSRSLEIGPRAKRSTLTKRMDARLYPAATRHWDSELLRERVLAKSSPGALAVDVGAGSGRIAELDVRAGFGRVYGIDRDPAVARNERVDVAIVGDAARLPLRRDSVDVVFSSNVLEHLEAPVQVLREIGRVLKPGGVLVAKTPNRWHYVTLVARLTPHRFHQYYNARRGRPAEDTFPTCYRANSARQLTRLAREAGLDVTRIDLVEGRPEYLRGQPLLYMLGALYERLVNRTDRLAWLRVVIIATFTKPHPPEAGTREAALQTGTPLLGAQVAGGVTFSLIVPTYNEESDIATTLEALLRLRGAGKEIIVVDDSTDSTPAIVARFADRGVRLLRPQERKGRCEARNLGALAARGEVLVFINADVRPAEDFLEVLTPVYEAGYDCASVMNRVENTDRVYSRLLEARRHWRIANGVYDGWARAYDGVFWTEGFSVRKSRAVQAGLFASGFDVPIEAGEDARFAEALRRVGCRGKFLADVVVPHVAPDTLREFWRTRAGRGAGTPQIRRYLDRWPWWKVAAWRWVRLAVRVGKLVTVVPVLVEGRRLARHLPGGRRGDTFRFAWALCVEYAAVSFGEHAAYRRMRRAERQGGAGRP